jgi:hypothetical protein
MRALRIPLILSCATRWLIDVWRSKTIARAPRCDALRDAIQSARNVYEYNRLVVRLFEGRKVEEELRYAASEASREGQATK